MLQEEAKPIAYNNTSKTLAIYEWNDKTITTLSWYAGTDLQKNRLSNNRYFQYDMFYI